MDYLDRQVFRTPTWMLDADLLYRFQDSGSPDRIQQLQAGALNQVLNLDRMKRLVEDEAFRGADAYALGEMLSDLRRAVWTELEGGRAIDTYRRNLQRAYLERVSALLADEGARPTDIVPFLRGELELLTTQIEGAGAMARGRTSTALHLQDVLDRIEKILDPED
jgi:hypothetical protein